MYPLLEIRRGGSVTPVQTFTSWEGLYKHEDMRLCVLYHLREDQDFKVFEEAKLFGNEHFLEFKHVSESDGVYVFDLSKYKDDWEIFLKGKYSKLSRDTKKKIIAYHGVRTPNYPYVDSFLHPDRYFQLYAELLGEKESLLREVGELCSLPDLEQETLTISVKDLDMSRQTT